MVAERGGELWSKEEEGILLQKLAELVIDRATVHQRTTAAIQTRMYRLLSWWSVSNKVKEIQDNVKQEQRRQGLG